MGKILDRALETTTTEGTGAIEFAGVVSGYLSFTDAAAFQTGDSGGPWLTVNYQIEQRNASGTPIDWEIGVGTLYKPATGNPYITRDTIRSSSNGGAKVNFGSGTKSVWSAPQAADFNGLFSAQSISPVPIVAHPAYANITGYDYYDLTVAGGYDMDRSIVLAANGGVEEDITLQWQPISDTQVRFMWDTPLPGTLGVKFFTILTGFPKVHHLEIDFGTGSAGSFNSGNISLGVTLNDYQRAMVVPNFFGSPYVEGDARVDQVARILLASNTQCRMEAELNDGGNPILNFSVIEF